MKIPIIRVKDRSTGRIHIVGTDSHDHLHLWHGLFSYYNLQNGCGTGMDRECEYEFFTDTKDHHGLPEVEMVSIEEFIEIYTNEIKNEKERQMKREELFKKMVEDFEEA